LEVGFQATERAEMRVRLIAKNWNDEPPSVELLDGDGNYLSPERIPQNSVNIFHRDLHPATGRPFVCMAGAREYHIHTGHVSDSWDNYKRKEAYTLGGITTQLWNAWLKSNS
jgi:Predicted metal binding domain